MAVDFFVGDAEVGELFCALLRVTGRPAGVVTVVGFGDLGAGICFFVSDVRLTGFFGLRPLRLPLVAGLGVDGEALIRVITRVLFHVVKI